MPPHRGGVIPGQGKWQTLCFLDSPPTRGRPDIHPGHLLMELSHLQLAGLFSVLFVAYVVRGIAGFGSGLIAIPLLALVLPLPLAVPLVVALDFLASASQGVRDRQQIQWAEILPTLPFAVMGILAASVALKTAAAASLLKGLAVFILAYALYSLAGHIPRRRVSRWWAGPVGLLGGFVGTVFGTGGPFYVVYLQMRHLDKTAFRASFATLFLLDGSDRLIAYLLSGLLDLRFLMLLALCLPVVAIGIFLGGRIHADISQEAFRRGISLLLLSSGTLLLLR